MADFNQKQPGEKLTDESEKFRKQMMVKNTYQISDSDGYSPNHPNALSDGDDKGRGIARLRLSPKLNNIVINL